MTLMTLIKKPGSAYAEEKQVQSSINHSSKNLGKSRRKDLMNILTSISLHAHQPTGAKQLTVFTNILNIRNKVMISAYTGHGLLIDWLWHNRPTNNNTTNEDQFLYQSSPTQVARIICHSIIPGSKFRSICITVCIASLWSTTKISDGSPTIYNIHKVFRRHYQSEWVPLLHLCPGQWSSVDLDRPPVR